MEFFLSALFRDVDPLSSIGFFSLFANQPPPSVAIPPEYLSASSTALLDGAIAKPPVGRCLPTYLNKAERKNSMLRSVYAEFLPSCFAVVRFVRVCQTKSRHFELNYSFTVQLQFPASHSMSCSLWPSRTNLNRLKYFPKAAISR